MASSSHNLDLSNLAISETESCKPESKYPVILGKPVTSIEEISQNPNFVNVDDKGYVKKRIIEVGAGQELHNGYTVFIAYSGYWPHEPEPFDSATTHNPMVMDLKGLGILPDLQNALASMLVGEYSVFIITHHHIYGPLGASRRFNPDATCVYYVKLLRSVLTPEDWGLDVDLAGSERFGKIIKEARMLFDYGLDLSKINDDYTATGVLKKAVNILLRAKLSTQAEQMYRQGMLIQLYTQLAISNNKVKQPFQVFRACNKLNQLKNIWDDCTILHQHGKALRMIGAYVDAEKKLKRAQNLSPNNEEIRLELELLKENMEEAENKKAEEKEAAY